MQKFVLAYHGGPSSMSPEEGQKHMADWMAWMDGLGDAVIDRGVAVGQSSTVGPDGVSDDGGPNPLSGITTIEAVDLAAAIEMTKISPHITMGGTIEVAPVMDMSM